MTVDRPAADRATHSEAMERWGRVDVLVNSAGHGPKGPVLEISDRARIPMGRYGRAGEVSSLIAYLASEDAAYITGQNIRMDGGLASAV